MNSSPAIYSTITVTTAEGDSFTASHPSALVGWLCQRERWTSATTLSDHKADYARQAEQWSGKPVSTENAWAFLRDMESAGVLSIAFDAKEEPSDA